MTLQRSKTEHVLPWDLVYRLMLLIYSPPQFVFKSSEFNYKIWRISVRIVYRKAWKIIPVVSLSQKTWIFRLGTTTWVRVKFLSSCLFKGIKQLVADRKGNTLHIPGLLHEREDSFQVVKKEENQTRCKRSPGLISHVSGDDWCSWKWWHDLAPARPSSAHELGSFHPQNLQFWPTETTRVPLN